jgi:hypothetical protein
MAYFRIENVRSAWTARRRNSNPIALSAICGKWMMLAGFDTPAALQAGESNTALTAVISGYGRFAGNLAGESPSGRARKSTALIV